MSFFLKFSISGRKRCIVITQEEMMIEQNCRDNRPLAIAPLPEYIDQLNSGRVQMSEWDLVNGCLRWLDAQLHNPQFEDPEVKLELIKGWHRHVREEGFDDELVIMAFIRKVAAFQYVANDQETMALADAGRRMGIPFPDPVPRTLAVFRHCYDSNTLERTTRAIATVTLAGFYDGDDISTLERRARVIADLTFDNSHDGGHDSDTLERRARTVAAATGLSSIALAGLQLNRAGVAAEAMSRLTRQPAMPPVAGPHATRRPVVKLLIELEQAVRNLRYEQRAQAARLKRSVSSNVPTCTWRASNIPFRPSDDPGPPARRR
ncbi:hypothetical protein BR93DRAFT_965138 [Coniochaeta sp. PMI_546]|nr:hypothetical protein BR93DRAFT_965138 [Coniochaeta sp. PMI_546]